MTSAQDCVFCRILSGDLPCIPLFEDDLTKAFMDINPVARGHALVIPREHAATILTVSVPALQAVAVTVQRIARAIDRALQPAGLSIVQANGPGAAQTVGHFHMHVLPRTASDDLRLNWHLTPGSLRDIEDAARRIRAAVTPP